MLCSNIAHKIIFVCYYCSPSAHLLYATLLEACKAILQARQVLSNLVSEGACGGSHLDSHLARIYFERRNGGEPKECLDLFDASIERCRARGLVMDSVGVIERELWVKSLICQKAVFMCDVFPGTPEDAVKYLYSVIRSRDKAFDCDESLPIVKCAYTILCKYSDLEERDQKITDLLCAALTRSTMSTEWFEGHAPVQEMTVVDEKIDEKKECQSGMTEPEPLEAGEVADEPGLSGGGEAGGGETLNEILDYTAAVEVSVAPFAAGPALIAIAEQFLTSVCCSIGCIVKLNEAVDTCKRELIRSKTFATRSYSSS
jgi:hypothetical protein